MRASVAGAPVSFGVFEMTPEGAEVLAPDDLLNILEAAGYDGVDLGPDGYLGSGPDLDRRLASHGLSLSGGWVQLPFSASEEFERALPEYRRILEQFAATAMAQTGPPPKPTLADDGSASRRAAPGKGEETDPLSESAWDHLTANLTTAVTIARDFGLEPTFHHHAGTYIESTAEIEQLLNRVEVDLTLDTGHLALAGVDPVALFERWGSRINHIHLKDVDLPKLERVLAAGGDMTAVWSAGVFVALGLGDLDLRGLLDAAQTQDYSGWIVVEQDILPAANSSLELFRQKCASDQRISREALRPWC